MTSFERIVRPFETPDVAPPKRAAGGVSDLISGGKTVTLKVGDNGGSSKIFNGSVEVSESFFCQRVAKEGSGGADPLAHDGSTQPLKDDSSPRKVIIERIRNQEKKYEYHDQVIVVGHTIRDPSPDGKTGSPGDERWVVDLKDMPVSDDETDRSEPFVVTTAEELADKLKSWFAERKEELWWKMVIFRVRNQSDKSQWVDTAQTVGYKIYRPFGTPLEGSLEGHLNMKVAKPEDLGEEFLAQEEADVKRALEAFASAHPE